MSSQKARKIDAESRNPRVSSSSKGNSNYRSGRPSTKVPESDSDNYVSGQSDDEIEQEFDMPVKDDSRRQNVKTHTPRNKEKKSTSSKIETHTNVESKSETISVAKNLAMLMIGSVYHLRLGPNNFPTPSTYKPSFYSLFHAISAMHNVVHENTYLRYEMPDYISIASSLYYAIVSIIQVYRAGNAIGILDRQEQQVLRKFERDFPFESLPIASPLIPFFQNLGAVTLPDAQYGPICPKLPIVIGTSANIVGGINDSANICLPNVPALIKFLYEIGQSNIRSIFDVDGTLVPPSFVAGNNNFLGIDRPARTVVSNDFQRLAYSAGWLMPPETRNQIDKSLLTNISRWQIPNISAASAFDTPMAFLQMERNTTWFKKISMIASTESKFFRQSTNLANIAPVTGLSSLVEINYTNDVPLTAIMDIYPMSNNNFVDNIWEFTAQTTRGTTVPDEMKLGATSQFLVTNFGQMVPANHQHPAPSLQGAYFDPILGGRSIIQIQSDEAKTPFVSFETIIRNNLYDVSGGQLR